MVLQREPPSTSAVTMRCNDLEDRISYLPDEILINVLSRLEIEEQARTSILARRWMHLWRYTTSLRFVFDDHMDFYDGGEILYLTRCREFVNCVNHILELLHLAATIDDFTVMFCLNVKTYQQDIDAWLRFALQKRVRRLNFEFMCSFPIENNYTLSADAICNHKFDSLTSICLKYVDVTGEFLEYLLSVAPLLEELSVSCSTSLVNLTVSGPSLKLKYLEIKACREVQNLHIYNVNLVSFKYSGYAKCVVIEDTPCLVKVHFPQFLNDNDMKNGVRILSSLCLVETLILELSIFQDQVSFPKFPVLNNLKHLVLKLEPNCFGRLLCARVLEAAPFLNEFEIDVDYLDDRTHEEKKVDERLERPHNSLRVLKLIGFTGGRADMEIALYIINIAPALEKVIIDTHHPQPSRVIDPEMQEAAATLARDNLGTRLPLGVQFIVI